MPDLSPICRRLVRGVLMLSTLFAGGLLLLEGCVRIFCERIAPLSLVDVPPVLRESALTEFDPAAGFRLRSGLREARAFGTVVTTNSRGFRMEREAGPKPPAQLRILCLGGGATFGAFVGSAEPWPQRLEALLRDEFPNKDIEVVNAACPGDTVLRGEARLAALAGELEPDFVMANFFAEDIATEGILDLDALGEAPALRTWAPHSQLAVLLWKWSRPEPSVPFRRIRIPRVPLEDYVFAHIRMKKFCKRRGMGFHAVAPLIGTPTGSGLEADLTTDYAGSLKDGAAWHTFPLLGSAELDVRNKPDAAKFFHNRHHLNAAGHDELARSIAVSIRREVQLRINEIAENHPEKISGSIE